jgi:phenylpropionate dioxygenase-like ring-hydroxylating dioxygenase large terminal subunit
VTGPLVDIRDRTVSSRVFTDPSIFAQEQATVFTRSWLYLGHRSQLREPGDFIQTYAGTRPLLLCLGEDGEYNAIANVCAHRGGRICQLEYGRADRFVCPYHNWVYNNRGDLVAVPRRSSPAFDRSRWGLQKAARVATYGDLIFAAFSPDVPSLNDYLGDMRFYLDLFVKSSTAGTEVSAGTHRSAIHCNWKIPAEQFGSDNWHFQAVHGSVAKLGRRNEEPGDEDSFHAWMPQGHMLISIAPKAEVPTAFTFYLDQLLAKGQISPVQRRLLRCSIIMTVFPNLSIVFFPGLCSIRVWHPRAAGETELWSWALYNKDAPAVVQSSIRKQVTRMFSPTGMLEQDDLEVWVRLANNLMNMPPSYRLCYDFDSEEGKPRAYPGMTTSLQSDIPAFSFYRRWADMIAQGGEARHAQ